MNENTITITGNICSDVVGRTTAAGAQVTTFRLASTPRRFRNGTWEDGETSYFSIACWRSLGQNVLASVHRGDPVMVRGLLRVRKWESSGASGTEVEIDAQSVGFDLARGTAVFSRPRRVSEAPLAEAALAAGLRADSASEALESAA